MRVPRASHKVARALAPGDHLVVRAGDVRRLVGVEVLASDLIGLDFGDGRHSLLNANDPVVVLSWPDTPTPPQPTQEPSSD